MQLIDYQQENLALVRRQKRLKMKKTTLIILIITIWFGCLGQKRLSEKDCVHSHICCDVYCPCCPKHGFGQGYSLLDASEIANNYVEKIDSLKNKNNLEKISYPNMSACGGGLNGYYLDKKLVLIDATYQAELGFSSRTFYVDNNIFVFIIYREHFAEWEKYEQKYPSNKYEFDASKMTYTDTLYKITLTTPILFEIISNDKLISNRFDEKSQLLIPELLKCAEEMKQELNEITNNKSPNR